MEWCNMQWLISILGLKSIISLFQLILRLFSVWMKGLCCNFSLETSMTHDNLIYPDQNVTQASKTIFVSIISYYQKTVHSYFYVLIYSSSSFIFYINKNNNKSLCFLIKHDCNSLAKSNLFSNFYMFVYFTLL